MGKYHYIPTIDTNLYIQTNFYTLLKKINNFNILNYDLNKENLILIPFIETIDFTTQTKTLQPFKNIGFLSKITSRNSDNQNIYLQLFLSKSCKIINLDNSKQQVECEVINLKFLPFNQIQLEKLISTLKKSYLFKDIKEDIINIKSTSDFFEVLKLIDLDEEFVYQLNIQTSFNNFHSTLEKAIEQHNNKLKLKETFTIDSLASQNEQNTTKNTYEEKIKKLPIKDPNTKEILISIAKKVDKQLNSYGFFNNNPELNSLINYLDTVLKIPFNRYKSINKKELNLNSIKKQLDKTHYGLEQVKDKILQFIAEFKRSSNNSSQILALIGAPGVGKTSIAKSIAKALSRSFVKISLAGIKDEAAIRGHRRTYVGAMPGKLIEALIKANSMDPVILLDEIDKTGINYTRDDISSALLEVLDPEQNKYFKDHYINFEIDLSKVLFIITANDINNIDPTLLDRLEIINIQPYSLEDKIQIAKFYIIPKFNNDFKFQLKFNDEIIKYIITNYTPHSEGIRSLEKTIKTIYRKIAILHELYKKPIKNFNINKTKIDELLYNSIAKNINTIDTLLSKNTIGTTSILSYSNYFGGEVSKIEVELIPNNLNNTNNIIQTGNLGKVLRESIITALDFIKANNTIFKINPQKFTNYSLHINFLNQATPKDGPSAGIAILLALISALKNTPVKPKLASTGEITLKGDILPVGKIEAKLLAAKEKHLKYVIIPYLNYINLDKNFKQKLTKNINLIPVKNAFEAIAFAFDEYFKTNKKLLKRIVGDGMEASAQELFN